MLAIIGASGKIGGATLDALLTYKLLAPEEIVACTTSSPGAETWKGLEEQKVHVRHATFEDAATMEQALSGCEKLFLVSDPRTKFDFKDAGPDSGRENHHIAAIDAARRAGVKHIYYTSLAFGSSSKAGVMRAHLRTEEYLAGLSDIEVIVLREGLYNESWPLYLGYFDPEKDDRDVVVIGGDSKISWTAITDLGLASALVIVSKESEYAGRTLYLSGPPENAKTMAEVAELVGQARSRSLSVEIVSREAHEAHYIQDRKMEAPAVEWWSTTYDALRDGECLIKESQLTELLQSQGRTPKPISETIREMVHS